MMRPAATQAFADHDGHVSLAQGSAACECGWTAPATTVDEGLARLRSHWKRVLT